MNKKAGFTLPEIIITIGIAAVLLALGTANIFNAKHKASSTSTLQTLITDLNQQRIKAMVGDTEGRGTHDNYGVYFTANTYVLFHGSTYSSSDTSNFTIDAGDSVQFTNITLPQSQIVFSAVSGEFANYAAGSNTIRVTNTTTTEYKTITINKLGTISSIN